MTTHFGVQYSCSPEHNGRGSSPHRDGCRRWHLVRNYMTNLSTLTPLGSSEPSRDFTATTTMKTELGLVRTQVSTTHRSCAYSVRSCANADAASDDFSRSVADGADTERSRANVDVACDDHSRLSADVVSQRNEHYLELHAAGALRDGFEVVTQSNRCSRIPSPRQNSPIVSESRYFHQWFNNAGSLGKGLSRPGGASTSRRKWSDVTANESGKYTECWTSTDNQSAISVPVINANIELSLDDLWE
jgi:hypothetical protein